MAKAIKPTSSTPSDAGSLPKGFDIDAPKLPKAIEEGALASGGYPHEQKLKREEFETALEALQIELLKLQAHLQKSRDELVGKNLILLLQSSTLVDFANYRREAIYVDRGSPV